MKLPFRSTLARNTLWMSFGQGLRLIIQAAFFAVIARSLGAANYGAFVGVAAFVGIAYPFGSLGSANIMVRDVARDSSSFATSYGAALFRTLLFGSSLVALIIALSHFALPHDIPRRLIVIIAFSDILGLNFILLSAVAFQSFERMNWTSGIHVLTSTSRLIAALILIYIHPKPSALQWGYAYMFSTILVMIVAFCMVIVKLGWPRIVFWSSWAVLREGSYFAAALSAQTIYNDLDKTMLARLGTLEAAGIYGAAYRLVEVSFSPVFALLSAAYPKFFRVGMQGIWASVGYAKSLLLRAFSFSLVVCVVLILGAGLVPIVLGVQYAHAAEALRWLAVIVPLRTIHAFLSDVLTSVDRQGLRTLIQVGVALVNATINLWAIPAYSWKGASVSSVISDALLALAVGTAVWIIARRSPTELITPDDPVEAMV
jgi:O-antigen/teichoic acid export membrane protein